MHIASTVAPGRGDTDLLLHRVSQELTRRGLRVCGTVQINTERATSGPCDMDVKVLPDGPIIRISQDLGTSSKGCRLDSGALETAVANVAAELARGADVLIVNKFGKHEAEGRGFREVIAEALARKIPVLVGLNGLNRSAFEAFTEGLGKELPPDAMALNNWLYARSQPQDETGAGKDMQETNRRGETQCEPVPM